VLKQVRQHWDLGWPSDSRELLTSVCSCEYPEQDHRKFHKSENTSYNVFFKDTVPILRFIGF